MELYNARYKAQIEAIYYVRNQHSIARAPS